MLLDLVTLFLFLNGPASFAFHYTLYSTAGTFDTFTMIMAVCFAHLFAIRIIFRLATKTLEENYTLGTRCIYLSVLIFLGPQWVVALVFTELSNTGIDFTWLFGLLAFELILLLFIGRLFYSDKTTSKYFFRGILFSLAAAGFRLSSDGFCATEEWARQLWFFHSIWHVLIAIGVGFILLSQSYLLHHLQYPLTITGEGIPYFHRI
jgi:predicted membrane channel-forming protein YqfA (hemolysin III family)